MCYHSPELMTSVNMDLREYIFRNNISISDLAKRLDTARQYIYRWLDGSQFPSKKLLEKISVLTEGKITKFDQLMDRRLNDQKKDRGSDKESGSGKEKS
jgi:transcriptional regulator with XRE-family HTH domain